MAAWRTHGEGDRGGSWEAGQEAAGPGGMGGGGDGSGTGMVEAQGARWVTLGGGVKSEPTGLASRGEKGKGLGMKPGFLV